MILNVLHKTTYSYATPLLRSTQIIRLWPQNNLHQRVLSWDLELPGDRISTGRDCFDNITYCLSSLSGCQEIKVTARGVVETLAATPKTEAGNVPLEYYLNQTELTRCESPLQDFIQEQLGVMSVDAYRQPPADLLAIITQFSAIILEHVRYTRGVTDSTTTASTALLAKAGVCQDHTHVLLSCCRYLGIPARYVSGYLYTHDEEHLSSHAWAEIWFNGAWHSFDVSNQCSAGETHIELAYGLDYLDAAPVRGSRVGGDDEQLAVISLISQQQ